jgi:hypothetical protein
MLTADAEAATSPATMGGQPTNAAGASGGQGRGRITLKAYVRAASS